MKSKLPLFIILAGLLIMGIGGWQLIDAKLETASAVKKAKAIIAEQESKVDIPDNETIPDAPKNNRIPGDSKKNTDKGKSKKPKKVGDIVGLLTIPKIKAELPIVEGTDPDDLMQGVGHYKGSYFPKENGQIVLSGHRDTVFRHVGKLKIGDSLIVKLPKGTFTYKIDHTKIVKANDTSIITLQHDQEELILTTCYPFRYVGNAPDRYIIYAYPAKIK